MPERTQALASFLVAGLSLLVCLMGWILLPEQRETRVGTIPNTYRINVNKADAHTLCLLPRIGPGIAQRMIDDRQAHGPFRNTSQLTRVPMIGHKTAQALKPWVVFEMDEQ